MDRFMPSCLLLAGLITAWPVAAQSNSPAGSSSAPVLLITPALLAYRTVAVGTTNDQSLVVLNGGGGLLTGTASVGAPFSIVSGADYSLAGNQQQRVIIRYNPNEPGSHTQSVSFSGVSGVNATVRGQAANVNSSLSFSATNGTIAPPFAVVENAVSQPIESGVADGGRAIYGFTITNSGPYVISAEVSAPNAVPGACYLSVDTEPVEPIAIWDIPPTAGFTNQLVTWRGEKSLASPAPIPKVFQLAAGNHFLIVGGKAAGTQLKSLTLLSYSDKPPSPTNLRVISAQ